MYSKIVSILTLVLFAISSCTEIVELELEGSEKAWLMVEGNISTEKKQHEVRLSYSADYFLNQQTPATNGAEVSISDGEQTFQLTEKELSGHYYTDSIAGEVGKTYTLNIKLENDETYTSSSLLKPISQIDSIRFSYEYFHPWRQKDGYDVYLYVQERKGRGDAYLFDLYIGNQLLTDTLRNRTFVDDNEVEGQYIHDWDVFWINKDNLSTDTTSITVSITSIPLEYYDYITEIMLETDWRGSIFDGPAANPKGNISNGGLGFFYACDVKKYSRDLIVKQAKGN